jgi:hypothetical protein
MSRPVREPWFQVRTLPAQPCRFVNVIVFSPWAGGTLAPPGLVPQWLIGAASRT